MYEEATLQIQAQNQPHTLMLMTLHLLREQLIWTRRKIAKSQGNATILSYAVTTNSYITNYIFVIANAE